MARASFQVLVFPFQITNGKISYCIFRRADNDSWQAIAGGGEDLENPENAAKREANEEAGIDSSSDFMRLQTVSSIPVTEFKDSHLWGDSVFVVPEYTFGVLVASEGIKLSNEHKEFKWVNFCDAYELLKYDGNRTALWELDRRVRNLGPRD
jgi:dATP pyrophosphohydrolase